MHTAVEQQQVLLAVGERLLQQSTMILHETTTCHSVAMTLLTPVMATGKLRLLYAALGPAAAHSNGLVTHCTREPYCTICPPAALLELSEPRSPGRIRRDHGTTRAVCKQLCR